MPGVTPFCDCNHIGKIRCIRAADGRVSAFTMASVERQIVAVELLREAVGLGDCTDGYRVVDVGAAGVERFAVEFQ